MRCLTLAASSQLHILPRCALALQVGTALFVAPEVMQNFSGGRYDGQAADVWACGVCLFIMLFGRHPYLRAMDNNLNEQQQMIKLFQRMMQVRLVAAGPLAIACFA